MNSNINFNDINKTLKGLVEEYQATGDEKIFEKILMVSKPLINFSIKNSKYPSTIERDELISVCQMSMYDVAKKYNINNCGKITNYAITSMKNSLFRYIKSNQSIIRISEVSSYKYNAMKKFESEFIKENYCNPKKEDFFLHFEDITDEDYEIYIRKSSVENYLDIDEVEEKNSPSYTQEEFDNNFLQEELMKYVKTLNERQQKVIIGIYYKGMTLEALSKELNITRERVRQIHNSSLENLRKIMNRNDFDF